MWETFNAVDSTVTSGLFTLILACFYHEANKNHLYCSDLNMPSLEGLIFSSLEKKYSENLVKGYICYSQE